MMNWYDKAKAIAESLMKQKGTEAEKLHRAAMEGMRHACDQWLNATQDNHSCRQCVHCDWHGQYCMAKDEDMCVAYMRAQKRCIHYKARREGDA